MDSLPPPSQITTPRTVRRLPAWLRPLDLIALVAILLAGIAIGARNHGAAAGGRLLNVSYDPTRELYRELNARFAEHYLSLTGRHATVVQSHGGSSRQARSVISGEQSADVVTLGLPSDVAALVRRGLVAQDWTTRLPNRSRPYTSTIIFVVRRGNPRGIHDWPDLIRPGVDVITPDPKSSGNGKLSVLAAYGSVVLRGGTDDAALVYLKALFDHAPFLEPAARSAANAFALEELGDVHVTWENEALREVEEAKGRLELVYPPVSILAEPSVAWVDSTTRRQHSEVLARSYLEFLFSDTAQELIARNGYRPFKQSALNRSKVQFANIELFPVTRIGSSWEDVEQRFLSEGGLVDNVYRPKPRGTP